MNDGRVICGASRNGHEGEASARFLIGQGLHCPGWHFRPGPKTLWPLAFTRRGVRAATGHEKGRSGQVTGRPVQKMHVVATISGI